jgi:lipopolysaccharide/colanic/teichoic acid biosynthesis glycosyltransferase
MTDFIRRALDIGVALVVSLVTLPIWGLAALLVRLDSPGPVLYRARRAGRHGQDFAMYKFRSMYESAGGGAGITGPEDNRITRSGRALRALKIDELPQLVNVIRGDMSLVGPRPEDPRYVAHYPEQFQTVLSVRPGITGPTQIVYWDEASLLSADDPERQYVEEVLPRKLESDITYVRSRTLGGDIVLLFRTLIAAFSRRLRG